MNTHILLVEGTSGTGKSTLIKHLLTRHILEEGYPRTLVHLSQAHTYFTLASPDLVQPPGKRVHREQLRRLLRMVDPGGAGFSGRAGLSGGPIPEPTRWFTLFALIDTLHLTHVFRPAILSWSELGYVDRELDRLGARMIFMRASPQTLWERLVVGRGASPEYFTRYQRQYGDSPEAVHAYYVQEQERMEALARKSHLPVLFLDGEGENVEPAYRFWKMP